MHVDGRERLRAIVGAGLGIAFAALICRLAVGAAGGAWIIAPLGASAVLVFAVPSSPLAQPWSVVGGNTLSCLVGTLAAHLLPDPALAGAVAVMMAIAVMFALRCLHPPGGAAALFAAVNGVSWGFALFPALSNSLLLVLVGILFNTVTGRRYPHAPAVPVSEAPAARFTPADIEAALDRFNGVVDVTADDLGDLLRHAEAAAYVRTFGELRCRDIMSREPASVEFGTGLDEAWALLEERAVKALPVVDPARRVIGILTLADFMRHAGLDGPRRLRSRMRAFVRPSGLTHGNKPEAVGQIMTAPARCVGEDEPLADIVPLYAHAGHHHLPVVDGRQRLVGMVTESDMVKALHAAVRTGS